MNASTATGEPSLDHLTLAAVGFVADALAKIVEPGNFVLAAIDKVLKAKTGSSLDFASRAFDSLDGATRFRVWRIAERDARSFRLEQSRLLRIVPKRRPHQPSATPDPTRR